MTQWRQKGQGMDGFSGQRSRREVLRSIGVTLLAAPMARIMGCEDPADSPTPSPDVTPTATVSPVATSTPTSATDWATGGTASMSGTYPDPFTAETSTSCEMYCQATLGPCYAQTIERKDISEGYTGLPMRISFKIVDESCKPISGATVDIWHTQRKGLYSGNDTNSMCTDGDADAQSHRYFRGVQTTDANGRVDFDSCFPGWYSSRTVHVHFTVRRGSSEYLTSQLVFDQDLVTEIFSTHPEYAEFGQPDTSNANDNVVGGEADMSVISFNYAKMSDGALQVYKKLVIRSALSESLCSISGGSSGTGTGNPPPKP